MSYCSLEEAYGKEFCQQVNNNYMLGNSAPYTVSKMNPTRNDMYLPGARHDTEISRVKYSQNAKQNALVQASQDIQTHRQSFDSISGVIPRSQSTKTITPWGDELNYDEHQSVDELSPREHLKKSLLKDRIITDSNYGSENNDTMYEPQGFLSSNHYKTLENSKCQDYFFHLDTCKKCQDKLKKRVIRYFKILQKYNKTPQDSLLPGTRDRRTDYLLDKELFSDNADTPINDQYEVKKNKTNFNSNSPEVIENFSNFNKCEPNTKAILLMLFGLFIIYALDSSKK